MWLNSKQRSLKFAACTFGHNLFPFCTFGQTLFPTQFFVSNPMPQFSTSFGQTLLSITAKPLVKSHNFENLVLRTIIIALPSGTVLKENDYDRPGARQQRPSFS